ncbi:uncharacterized protein LOC128720114 [Anopheles nili]|uniref:uncharacterized protein LOC128720114 n=1 Tax=Anopheles nili TaxID=185578 RepID=UPI00237B6CE0|nr:uncharacterized protein LOC128720114 [Anopheles nili]
MAKDNNNINTDELTGGTTSSNVKAVPSSTTEGEASSAAAEAQSTSPVAPTPVPPSTAEAPRREENPFSFKHFLKWDGNHTSNGSSAVSGAAPSNSANSINHSRSASSINGHVGHSLDGTGCSNGSNGPVESKLTANEIPGGSNGCSTGNNLTSTTTTTTNTGSPSKSATTSSLNVVSSTTGARPKIPQFQSVNTLSSESKMKRSPRFPSFDSQSSLSDFADDRFGSIYQSRSNGSFNSEYPTSTGAGGPSGSGPRDEANGSEPLGEQVELLRGYVQRSYTNYDPDSPGSLAVGSDQRNEPNDMHHDPPPGRIVGAAEFSAALPDFVQDHLVMEQWYYEQSKSPVPFGGGAGGVGSSSAELDDVLDLTGVANVSGNGASAPSCNDIPFDLTASSTTSNSWAREREREQNASFGQRHSLGARGPPPTGAGPELGFDLPPRSPTPASSELPPDLTEGNASGLGDAGGASGSIAGSGGRSRSYYYASSPTSCSGSAAAAADKIHRLPDFLSDGPIHSSGRLADVMNDTPHASETAAAAAAASERRERIQQQQREAQYQNRLSLENERLKRELDASRQKVSEQSRRIRELEHDLETMVTLVKPGGLLHREGANGSTQSNANIFLQAKTRAADAEAEMHQLKRKMANMTMKMEGLRWENDFLREQNSWIPADVRAMGTGAGTSTSTNTRQTRSSWPRRDRSSAFLRTQTVALQQAATTAETNIRQLLSGVENLRAVANQIDTFRTTYEDLESADASDLIIPGGSVLPIISDDDDDDDEDPFGPAL